MSSRAGKGKAGKDDKNRPKSPEKKPSVSSQGKTGKRSGTPENGSLEGVNNNNTTSPANNGDDRDESTKQAELLKEEEKKSLTVDLDEFHRRRSRSYSRAVPVTPKKDVVVKRKKDENGRQLKSRAHSSKVTVVKLMKKEEVAEDVETMYMQMTTVKSPRFDRRGRAIGYSILGTTEEFEKVSNRKETVGECMEYEHVGSEQETDQVLAHDNLENAKQFVQELSTKDAEERKRQLEEMSIHDRFTALRDENALHLWRKRVAEWKKQQNLVGSSVNKHTGDLVMNSSEGYRKLMEKRTLLERAIPLYESGNASFFKNPDRIGSDLYGIHVSQTKTQKGRPTVLYSEDRPDAIKEEMGLEGDSGRVMKDGEFKFKWEEAKYFLERQEKMESILKGLHPHSPDISNLNVTGESKARLELVDGLLDGLDLIKEEEGGESEMEYGESDKYMHSWRAISKTNSLNGGRSSTNNQYTEMIVDFPCLQFMDNRINLEAQVGKVTVNYLMMRNIGSSTLFMNWKRIYSDNNFGVPFADDGIQRMFFESKDGTILPGEEVKFPIMFKSCSAGIFTEIWRLETTPKTQNKVPDIILRGVAHTGDLFAKQRQCLLSDLKERVKTTCISEILEGIIRNVRPRVPPPSRPDKQLLEELCFIEKNTETELFCSWEMLHSLQSLAETGNRILFLDSWKKENRGTEEEAYQSPLFPSKPWDLSLSTLNTILNAIPEGMDDNTREDMLTTMNVVIEDAAIPIVRPINSELYNVGYDLIVQLADEISTTAKELRSIYGLTERETNISESEMELGNTGPRSETPDKKGADKKKEKDASARVSSGGKRGGSGDADKRKGPGGDSKAPGSAGRKGTLVAASSKAGKSRDRRDKEKPEMSETEINEEGEVQEGTGSKDDPVMEAKYRQRLYVLTFKMMGDVCDSIQECAEEIIRNKMLLEAQKDDFM
eukprot:Nk52_evm39s2449 gene=Nk52_evmTU39s2449